MAKLRDPEGFAELVGLCGGLVGGADAAKPHFCPAPPPSLLPCAATILAVKAGRCGQITVGDCLQLSIAIDGRSLRSNKAVGCYHLLHAMGVFGSKAPSTLRAFSTCGQFSTAQLIDRFPISCRLVRDLLVAYLRERQPALGPRHAAQPGIRPWQAVSGGSLSATTQVSPRCSCLPRSPRPGSSAC